ncbi:hypothetical protein SLE2022_310000 [Rubroshorea leprosula]
MSIGRITSLSDEVLCHIISFLPTEDAVRTSILSTRWKYLYLWISNLELKYKTNGKGTLVAFTNFVDGALLQFRRPSIHRFCLNIWGNESIDPLHFDGWIQALLLHSIRDLDLFIHWDRRYGLPADLFTCETLVVLKLQLSNLFLQVPLRVCLPSLRVLDLYMFYDDDDFGEWLSFGCLALEDLVFQGTFLGFECKLNVSNASLETINRD